MRESYEGRQIVGVDLHRRRSVLVRISNGVECLRQVMPAPGSAPRWCWRRRTAGTGPRTHWPSWARACIWRTRWGSRRSSIGGSRPTCATRRTSPTCCGWAAAGGLDRPAVRELRGLVRHRAKLVAVRANLKCQIHGVLAGAGVAVPMSDLFGPAGTELLDRVGRRLGKVDRWRVVSLRRVLELVDGEIDRFQALARARLGRHRGYKAIQAIPGVEPVLAAVFVAEIGDVTRFPDPARLASWAGLTPRHRESDSTVRRGHITKQGPRLVRWAAVEAVQRVSPHHRLGQRRERVADRRGRNIGKVAAARELTRLVYYGLRDGHIRALAG